MASWFSQIESCPRYLVSGTARGQTLEETIAYMEANVLGKYRCVLPEAQRAYEEKERFAREFLADLKANL